MTKQLFKVWSADRIHKTAVVVSLESDDIFTDILTKSSNKLNIPGKKIVLEIDGTEVDNDTLQYFYQETFIILKENEMWEPMMSILPSECSPSNSSSTVSVPSILGNDLLNMDYQQTSIPQTPIAQATIAHTAIPQTTIAQTEIPQTSIPQISPQLITISEDYWNTYSIPWQDMHRDIITLCEQGVTKKSVVNRVIDFVINDIRKIKENIPTKCLKIIARKMVDKYPIMLKDVDDDGVVLGDGTHSILHKLIDRNNYLNRPHKRSLINNIVSSPTNIKIRKKMLSAKAGCSNWQPTETDQTEDNLDDIQKLLREQSMSLTHSKEEEETIISNLEKTYAIQRQFLNEVDSSSISNVMEDWPILLQEKFLFWHYEKLMNHSISNLTNNLLRKQRKIISFGENKKLTNLKSNDDTDAEQVSIECIKIVCKFFKEDFTFFMKIIEEDVALNVAEPPSACPSILYFENRNGGMYYVFAEGRNINEGTMCFHKAFQQLFCIYYMCNMAYPKELSCTLEFIQRYILKIHPDAGSKSKKQVASRMKVISLINKLKY